MFNKRRQSIDMMEAEGAKLGNEFLHKYTQDMANFCERYDMPDAGFPHMMNMATCIAASAILTEARARGMIKDPSIIALEAAESLRTEVIRMAMETNPSDYKEIKPNV